MSKSSRRASVMLPWFGVGMVRLWYSILDGRVASYYRYQVSVLLYDAGDDTLDQQNEAM